MPLQEPIDGMTKKDFGSRLRAGLSTDSYGGPLKELHAMPDDMILSPTANTEDVNINSTSLFAERSAAEERETYWDFEQRFGG